MAAARLRPLLLQLLSVGPGTAAAVLLVQDGLCCLLLPRRLLEAKQHVEPKAGGGAVVSVLHRRACCIPRGVPMLAHRFRHSCSQRQVVGGTGAGRASPELWQRWCTVGSSPETETEIQWQPCLGVPLC